MFTKLDIIFTGLVNQEQAQAKLDEATKGLEEIKDPSVKFECGYFRISFQEVNFNKEKLKDMSTIFENLTESCSKIGYLFADDDKPLSHMPEWSYVNSGGGGADYTLTIIRNQTPTEPTDGNEPG